MQVLDYESTRKALRICLGDKGCDTTDCGVKVIQSTAVQNGTATPLSTCVKWFVPNSETTTHICKDCRKKLEAM